MILSRSNTKMKQGLGVSVSSFLTGVCKSCISKPILINTDFTILFHGKAYSDRLLFQGFKGSQRWVHSSFSVEDDFLELGPPVIQGANTRLKLATEKREFFMSKDAYRNSTASKPLDMNVVPTAKDLLMRIEKVSHTHPKVEQPKNISKITGKNKCNSNIKNPPNSTSIENVPSAVVSELVEAASSFAKISSASTAKNLLMSPEKVSHTHPKVEKSKNISKITGKSKCNSNINNPNSISIENVPSAVKLSELIKAVSSFGKISSASLKSVVNGLDCCVVKFENEESGWRAVSAGKITIGCFHLPIRPLYAPHCITIRIKDIGKETAYTAVHSICKTIGELVGMAKASENSIDANFSLKEFSDAENILAELNNKIVDDCQWSAHLLAKSSSPALKSENEIPQLGLQVINRLAELKNEFGMRKIYTDDLEYMHLAIMHLEEHHTVDSGSEINEVVL